MSQQLITAFFARGKDAEVGISNRSACDQSATVLPLNFRRLAFSAQNSNIRALTPRSHSLVLEKAESAPVLQKMLLSYHVRAGLVQTVLHRRPPSVPSLTRSVLLCFDCD